MSIERETNPLLGLRGRLRAGIDRLRANGWPVAQTAMAASLAYFLAIVLIGNEQPFFAPIAAVIALGLTLGQRGRRVVELVFGVAVGLMVADLLVIFIGVGAVQIGVVVALAMLAVVFFSERTLLVNQAAVSAILVVVLQPPDSGFSPDRFLNALLGGVVALAVSYLFPINPERVVARAAHPIFDELAAVLEGIAAALERGDIEQAERVLGSARELDGRVRDFDEVIAAGHERPRRADPLGGDGPVEEHRHGPGLGPPGARGCRGPRIGDRLTLSSETHLGEVASTLSQRPFEPHPLLRDGHAQTIAGWAWPRRFDWYIRRTYARDEERLFEVEPGARLLARCRWQEDRTSHPTLLLVHGLGGSDASSYVLGTAALWAPLCSFP